MVRGVSMAGCQVILLQGAAFQASGFDRPANDNGAPTQEKTVTVRRKLDKSGVAVKIKVPVAEYVGVAVATTISAEGALTSSIELVHPDEDFNYRVFVEDGNDAVVAEWQNWGKKLRLPLYIRSGDGQLIPYSQQIDGVMVGQKSGRRMLATDAERRTRFARRRKPGQTG